MTSKRIREFLRYALMAACGLGAVRQAAAQCDGQWLPTVEHAGILAGEVHALCTWDADGAGPQRPWLVIGGEMAHTVDGQVVQNIVGWDGSAWQSFGDIPMRQVNALVDVDGELVAGTEYRDFPGAPPSTAMHWSGTAWEPLGQLNGAVQALLAFDGELYAGGDFSTADGSPADHIARWNGAAWEPLLGGGPNGRVLALEVYDGELYAAGQFSAAGDVLAENIARWDGVNWRDVGGGVNNVVRALENHEGDLIAAGLFGDAGGTPVRFIARWNGSDWSAMGNFNHRIWTLRSAYGTLYAGGQFYQLDGQPIGHIASWDGAEWSPLAEGTSSVVAALEEYDGQLVVGGYFDTAGAVPVRSLAVWDLLFDRWNTLDSGFRQPGIDIPVLAVAQYNGAVYAGGHFAGVDGRAASNLAAWNGLDWQSPLYGTSGAVEALTTISRPGIPPRSDLIVGGFFNDVGGEPGTLFHVEAHNVARYSNDLGQPQWAALGAGIWPSAVVYAVIEFRGDIIAAGQFALAEGQPVSHIARWDGAHWQPMGGGMGSGEFTSVYALAEYDGDLIAGGYFQFAGGVECNSIARWDGAAWAPLGSGMPFGTVQALALHDGLLVAGGRFASAGGVAARNVASWNGSTWSALGSGVNNAQQDARVYSLCPYNGDLIVGGAFTTAGGGDANAIARWDGQNWSALGSGVQESSGLASVRGMAVHRGELIVVGYFQSAGGMHTNNWARWTDTNVPWIAIPPAPQAVACGERVEFRATPAMGYSGLTYQWRREGVELVDGPAPGGAIISGANTAQLTINGASAAQAGQYDIVIANGCGIETSIAATLSVTGCSTTGDVNCDGAMDNGDIDAFVTALLDAELYEALYPNCSILNGDTNGDGAVDNADIDSFVSCLLDGGC